MNPRFCSVRNREPETQPGGSAMTAKNMSVYIHLGMKYASNLDPTKAEHVHGYTTPRPTLLPALYQPDSQASIGHLSNSAPSKEFPFA